MKTAASPVLAGWHYVYIYFEVQVLTLFHYSNAPETGMVLIEHQSYHLFLKKLYEIFLVMDYCWYTMHCPHSHSQTQQKLSLLCAQPGTYLLKYGQFLEDVGEAVKLVWFGILSAKSGNQKNVVQGIKGLLLVVILRTGNYDLDNLFKPFMVTGNEDKS